MSKEDCKSPNVWVHGTINPYTKGYCTTVKEILNIEKKNCNEPNIWVPGTKNPYKKGHCAVPNLKQKTPVSMKQKTPSPVKQKTPSPVKQKTPSPVKSETEKAFEYVYNPKNKHEIFTIITKGKKNQESTYVTLVDKTFKSINKTLNEIKGYITKVPDFDKYHVLNFPFYSIFYTTKPSDIEVINAIIPKNSSIVTLKEKGQYVGKFALPRKTNFMFTKDGFRLFLPQDLPVFTPSKKVSLNSLMPMHLLKPYQSPQLQLPKSPGGGILKKPQGSVVHKEHHPESAIYVNKQHAKMMKEQMEYMKTLDEPTKKALQYYTGNGYVKMNSQLNKGEFTKDISDYINLIDEAFKNVPPTKETYVLYRGIKLDKKIEKDFTSKTYVSTSSNKDVSLNFSGNKTHKCCFFEITVPKGSHVLPLMQLSMHNEMEILLSRDSDFKVVKHSFTPKGNTVITRYVEKIDELKPIKSSEIKQVGISPTVASLTPQINFVTNLSPNDKKIYDSITDMNQKIIEEQDDLLNADKKALQEIDKLFEKSPPLENDVKVYIDPVFLKQVKPFYMTLHLKHSYGWNTQVNIPKGSHVLYVKSFGMNMIRLPRNSKFEKVNDNEYNYIPKKINKVKSSKKSPQKPKSPSPQKPKSSSPQKPKSPSPQKPKSPSPQKPKSPSPKSPELQSLIKQINYTLNLPVNEAKIVENIKEINEKIINDELTENDEKIVAEIDKIIEQSPPLEKNTKIYMNKAIVTEKNLYYFPSTIKHVYKSYVQINVPKGSHLLYVKLYGVDMMRFPRNSKFEKVNDNEYNYIPPKIVQSKCKPNPKYPLDKYICNESTGKWVLKTGDIGKKILKDSGGDGAQQVQPKSAPKKVVYTKEQMYEKFKETFKDDLLGFIGKSNPKFRVATSGGYGVKMTLEEKHGIYGQINTKDIDLTVSVDKSSMDGTECYHYLYNKVMKFIKESGDAKNFKVEVLKMYNSFVPIFKYTRYYIIMIEYKKDEFIDLAITNMPIPDSMIDIPLSEKVGLPIKTEEAYLREFLIFVYMENVPGVNDQVYYKRNPVVGKLPAKGRKDILNSKLLCDKVKKDKYKEYCKLLKEITVEKLQGMPKYVRDGYFKSLKTIVNQ